MWNSLGRWQQLTGCRQAVTPVSHTCSCHHCPMRHHRQTQLLVDVASTMHLSLQFLRKENRRPDNCRCYHMWYSDINNNNNKFPTSFFITWRKQKQINKKCPGEVLKFVNAIWCGWIYHYAVMALILLMTRWLEHDAQHWLCMPPVHLLVPCHAGTLIHDLNPKPNQFIFIPTCTTDKSLEKVRQCTPQILWSWKWHF